MKFIVNRSSDYGSTDEQPCDGAIKEKIKFVSRAQISLRNSPFDDVWTIEIETLESLMNFIKRNDSVIIYEPYAYELPTIEIYDENPDY